ADPETGRQAENLAGRASAVLRQAGIERLLTCAVQARVAMHRGDLATVRQQLVIAQRLRPASTYVQPHLAVQAPIELLRVHFALADITGARTLMRETDEILLPPLLSTHIPAPEIAADLFLSPHTIGAQMRSIYRKLEASTRHQAVTRARELGLIDG